MAIDNDFIIMTQDDMPGVLTAWGYTLPKSEKKSFKLHGGKIIQAAFANNTNPNVNKVFI